MAANGLTREHAVFAAVATGLGMTALDGRWLCANDALCAMLGYTRDELLARSARDTSHPDDLAVTLGKIEALLAGRIDHFVVEKRYIRRDGTAIWTSVTAALARDGEGRPEGIVAAIEDIEPRRRAGLAARRLAAIVETSDDAIVAKDLTGIVNAWNQGAQAIFGYTPEEMIGQSILRLVPEHLWSEEEGILSRIRRGEKIVHFDTVRRHKEGRLIQVSLSISPVLDAEGRIIGASKIARDITERKRVEQALKDADRYKNEFLATLAHELRNPLAPIRNALQVMMLSKDQAVLESSYAMVERQMAQMVRLLEDLLDVNRIGLGKLDLRPETVELADIVAGAVETSRPVIEGARHTLTVRLPPGPVRLTADPLRLTQVLLNLINNACKYTPRGGQIELSAETGAGEVRISCRDNGIGIEPAMLESIFVMFQQSEGARERAQGGLGVGLTLSRQLVELHGGTLKAQSAGAGQGSTFIVTLPLPGGADAGAAGASPAPVQADTGTHSYRIVVVDDNPDIAESMTELLKLMGHEAVFCLDGPEALKAGPDFRPDLMLMDIGLPDISGHELARRVRATPWGEKIWLIAVTGWGQEKDREASREAGFNAHLVKPIDTVELIAVIERLRTSEN